jgi:ribosomal 30S subunit maturation factor RimM
LPGSQSLEEATRVFLVSPEGEAREYQVREVRGSGRADLAVARRQSSTATRRAHRRLRNRSPREELEPLEPGEYYLADLVGAEVLGPEGPIGEVVEVVVNPSVDSVRIRFRTGVSSNNRSGRRGCCGSRSRRAKSSSRLSMDSSLSVAL